MRENVSEIKSRIKISNEINEELKQLKEIQNQENKKTNKKQ